MTSSLDSTQNIPISPASCSGSVLSSNGGNERNESELQKTIVENAFRKFSYDQNENKIQKTQNSPQRKDTGSQDNKASASRSHENGCNENPYHQCKEESSSLNQIKVKPVTSKKTIQASNLNQLLSEDPCDISKFLTLSISYYFKMSLLFD